jgi:hypothetical protein
MKLLLVLILFVFAPCLGQTDTQTVSIYSKAVKAEYSIEIVLPQKYSPKEKYPIVYCADWYHTSGFLKAIRRWLEFGRSAENVILVGISNEKNAHEWALNRNRDFTPSQPHDNYSIGYTYAPALKLTGGAGKFVEFLRNELIPYVERKYTADTSQRGFIGYSLGGLLGTYILCHEPHLFRYYLISSPSLWWDNFSLINDCKANSNVEQVKQGRIYLSVGENEDGVMLQGFGMLKERLRANQSDSLVLKTEVLENERHASGLPVALYNGYRFLYGNK